MTRTEILELAKHADIQDAWFRTPHPGVVAQLERFANLVAAKEREDCATIVEARLYPLSRNDYQTQYNLGVKALADEIRSRT